MTAVWLQPLRDNDHGSGSTPTCCRSTRSALSTSQSLLATSLAPVVRPQQRQDTRPASRSATGSRQINGLNKRSATRATVSLAQTAESALGELTNNLQRVREIVQAATPRTAPGSRVDQEVQQRLAQVQRIATQTVQRPEGAQRHVRQRDLPGGANVGETITVGLSTSMLTTQIGKTPTTSAARRTTARRIGQQGTGVVRPAR